MPHRDRCSAATCDAPAYSRDLCQRHYSRARRAGQLNRLPDHEVVRLRRAVGIPETGPTRDMIEQWNKEEALR